MTQHVNVCVSASECVDVVVCVCWIIAWCLAMFCCFCSIKSYESLRANASAFFDVGFSFHFCFAHLHRFTPANYAYFLQRLWCIPHFVLSVSAPQARSMAFCSITKVRSSARLAKRVLFLCEIIKSPWNGLGWVGLCVFFYFVLLFRTKWENLTN